VQEVPLHVAQLPAENALSGHQNHFERLGEFLLMETETFTQQPSRPTANHRIAEFAGRDYPEAGGSIRRQGKPV
jgi:hypothetical protein